MLALPKTVVTLLVWSVEATLALSALMRLPVPRALLHEIFHQQASSEKAGGVVGQVWLQSCQWQELCCCKDFFIRLVLHECERLRASMQPWPRLAVDPTTESCGAEAASASITGDDCCGKQKVLLCTANSGRAFSETSPASRTQEGSDCDITQESHGLFHVHSEGSAML